MFTPFVSEQLGHYVYVLRDPRDDSIFYVGKGLGNRVFAHASAALAADSYTTVSLKLGLIAAIHAAGLEVRTEVLRFGLSNHEAYEVEAVAIQLLTESPPAALTNIVAGHHVGVRGWMSTDEAISLFEAPPAPAIFERVLLIRPTQLWYPKIPADELFDATHGWWVLNPRRAERADYVLSVSRGVVRQVYSPEFWRQQQLGDRGYTDGSGKPRWGFDGSVSRGAFAAAVVGTDVTRYFSKGARNSVRYLNC